MKCKLCGHEIKDDALVCPGCDNDIDYLIENGYIEGAKKTKKKNTVPKDFVIDNSLLKEDETYKKEEKVKPSFEKDFSSSNASLEGRIPEEVHTILAGREPVVIDENTPEVPLPEEKATISLNEIIPEVKEETIPEVETTEVVETKVEENTEPLENVSQVEPKEENKVEEVIPDDSHDEVKEVTLEDPENVDITEHIEIVPEENKKDKKKKKPVIVFKEHKKQGINPILVVIILVLLCAVMGATYFYTIYFNPANIYKKAFGKFVPELALEKYTKVDIDTTIEYESSLIDSTTINIDVILEDIKGQANIIMGDSKTNLIKNGNLIYIFNEELSDDYFEIEDSKLPHTNYYRIINFIHNAYEIKNLNTSLVKILLSKEFKDNYSKEYVTIKYNGEDKKVTQIKFNIDSNLVKKIKADASLVSSLMKLISYDTEEELFTMLDKFATEKYQLSLYTDFLSNNYYKVTLGDVLELELKDNKITNIFVNYNNKSIELTSNFKNITVKSLGGEVINFTNDYIETSARIQEVPEEYNKYEDIESVVEDNFKDSTFFDTYQKIIEKVLVEIED